MPIKILKDLKSIIKKKDNLGFDIDYTLLKDDISFNEASKYYKPHSKAWWDFVYKNTDKNAKINKPLVNFLKKIDKPITLITDRAYTSEAYRLNNFMHGLLGKKVDIHYQILGKFDRDNKYKVMKRKGLDFYLGDSNNDVRQTNKAGLGLMRIKRNSKDYLSDYKPDEDIETIFKVKW
jgi:acid phosphatase class B